MKEESGICCDGRDAHTTSTCGTGELGHRGAESERLAGAGGWFERRGRVVLGGNGGEEDDLWAKLREPPNHPDRLLVGGLLGPRRVGGGASNGQSPGADSTKSKGVTTLMGKPVSATYVRGH